jgi:G:T/U-mismatch repair DNA glycosylase
MTKIKHRFSNHKIDPKTETLIIGTFNPETSKNSADFFYGRQRNFLWTLIPHSFGEESLKEKPKDEKIKFIQRHKIDFIDIISEVDVDEVSNYDDAYLDNKVTIWKDIITEIKNLQNIKRICVTRKTFNDVPNIKAQVNLIKEFCDSKNIFISFLPTPARFYNQNKQDSWTEFFVK